MALDDILSPVGDLEDMLMEIRARALLDGTRGKPPLDKQALVDTLLRVGQLVVDFHEIAELDINPLMVYPRGQGAIAIDMRLVLQDSHKEALQNPPSPLPSPLGKEA